MHLLFVVEYGAAGNRGMMGSLIDAIQDVRPQWQIRSLHGFIRTYRPGGLRPARLLNLVYLYFRVLLILIARRPDVIVAATSPPFLQIWVALLGSLFRSKVLVWLLDYHPEIEARWLDRRGLSGIAAALRWIDRISLGHTALVVGLDDGMVKAVHQQNPRVVAVTHPTWDVDRAEALDSEVQPALDGGLRLAYVGNLGVIHDTGLLERLCLEIQKVESIEIMASGCSDAGNQRFGDLCRRVACRLQTRPRCKPDRVGDSVREFRPHYGIVLLRDDYAGLASPSKFMAYLRWGLPLVYIGPPGTNAHTACTRFGAGLSLSNRASDAEVTEAARTLTDPKRVADFRAGVKRALEHFSSFNAQTMARLLVDALSDRPSVERQRVGDTGNDQGIRFDLHV